MNFMDYRKKRRRNLFIEHCIMMSTMVSLVIAGFIVGWSFGSDYYGEHYEVYHPTSEMIIMDEPVTNTIDKFNAPNTEQIIQIEQVTQQTVSVIEEKTSNVELLCPKDDGDKIDLMTLDDIIIDVSNVATISNASEDMIESALTGTWLEGYGSLYYELEHEYNVNAFIAIGNAFQETGWDISKSVLATNDNNIYGIMNKSFDSIEDCIHYYFRLIHKHYIGEGYITLEEINGKYCPPDDTWDNDIYSIAKKLKNKIDITPK